MRDVKFVYLVLNCCHSKPDQKLNKHWRNQFTGNDEIRRPEIFFVVEEIATRTTKCGIEQAQLQYGLNNKIYHTDLDGMCAYGWDIRRNHLHEWCQMLLVHVNMKLWIIIVNRNDVTNRLNWSGSSLTSGQIKENKVTQMRSEADVCACSSSCYVTTWDLLPAAGSSGVPPQKQTDGWQASADVHDKKQGATGESQPI